MIEQLGFAGYFLIVWDIVRVLPEPRHLLPGAGVGGQFGGVLRPRDHQRRRGRARACSSSGSCPPSATGRPTSTWTSRAAGGRRPSSTCTAATGGSCAAQVANVITYRPRPRCGTWARPWARRPGSSTPGPSRWTAGGRSAPPPVRRPRHPGRGDGPGRRGAALSPPSRHPLGGHGALRPARWPRCARWSGPAWPTAASCSGTRTTARRPGWSSSTCSASGC